MAKPTRPKGRQIFVTQADITRGLRALGLKRGASALAHSSLSSFGRVKGGADAVIDALLETVGPEGTILVPTLTGSQVLCAENPPVFNPELTPCWTGRIPETFRKRPEAIRSLHPTHSVAAIGAGARPFTIGHEYSITPCGPDSPYGRLVEAGGYILLLGVTHSSNTIFHLAEEIVGVSYHMQPGWVMARLVRDGTEQALHLMIHRYGSPRDFERMEPVFLERRIQREVQIGAARVRLIDARRMVETTTQALRQDPAILLAR